MSFVCRTLCLLGIYNLATMHVNLRYEPFLWISDLSAPDTSHWSNLFGLLPFAPVSFLGTSLSVVLMAIAHNIPAFLRKKKPQTSLMGLVPILSSPWISFSLVLVLYTLMFSWVPSAAVLFYTINNLLTGLQDLYFEETEIKAEDPESSFFSMFEQLSQ